MLHIVLVLMQKVLTDSMKQCEEIKNVKNRALRSVFTIQCENISNFAHVSADLDLMSRLYGFNNSVLHLYVLQ